MNTATFSEVSTLPSKPHHFTRANLIDTLIDETVQFIQYIWPAETSKYQGIPLRVFIQEILRRSHTSFSALLTALIYLFRLKTALAKPKECANKESAEAIRSKCGRRMFLSAIIVATKFLQDKGITNTAWASLSGLNIREINENERIFLELIEYNMFVTSALFSWWSTLLISKIDNSSKVFVRGQATDPSASIHQNRKKAKTNSFSPYPSLHSKCATKYDSDSYVHTTNAQFNIELSPPFLESSSSEDEE